jgi:hypothetical protein
VARRSNKSGPVLGGPFIAIYDPTFFFNAYRFLLSPIIAAAAMALSSVIVNAGRIPGQRGGVKAGHW